MAHPKRPAPREQRVESLHQERMMAAALWEVQKASHEAGLDSPAGCLVEHGRPDWDE
jgi:hypothetical protein